MKHINESVVTTIWMYGVHKILVYPHFPYIIIIFTHAIVKLQRFVLLKQVNHLFGLGQYGTAVLARDVLARGRIGAIEFYCYNHQDFFYFCNMTFKY